MADPRTVEDLDAIADQLLGELEQLEALTSRVKAAIIAASNRARRLVQERAEQEAKLTKEQELENFVVRAAEWRMDAIMMTGSTLHPEAEFRLADTRLALAVRELTEFRRNAKEVKHV